MQRVHGFWVILFGVHSPYPTNPWSLFETVPQGAHSVAMVNNCVVVSRCELEFNEVDPTPLPSTNFTQLTKVD